MKKDKNPNRVRGSEKLAYFFGNLGNIPVMSLIGSYLLIFYTDVCGLNPISVGTLFLLTKILDGVNDPIMGYLIDHIKTRKMGHFRPVLLIGSLVCALNFLILWLGPAYLPDAFKLVVAYISYILIGISFDLMDIPLNSLIPVMTSDPKERNGLSLIKGIGYIIGGVLVSMIPPLVISAIDDTKTAYTILVVAIVGMISVFSVICALGVKERIQPEEGENYRFKELWPILTCAPVLVMFLANLVF